MLFVPHTAGRGPSLHRHYPASSLLRPPPTSVIATTPVMHSRHSPGAQPPRSRISQVPRPSSRYAPPACTPEDWTTAYAYAFIAHAGFIFSERLAILVCDLGAETGSRLRIAAHTVRLPRLRHAGYPLMTPGRLHVHRHLHDRTFHSIRTVRLGLTHQRPETRDQVPASALQALCFHTSKLFTSALPPILNHGYQAELWGSDTPFDGQGPLRISPHEIGGVEAVA